jgi:AcrR family transcriptional regulator
MASGRRPPTGPGTARAALLDRCVEFLVRDGFSQLSLREIAAGAGTSHRMLIYHFGSREGLLAEVVGRVEAEQRAALADLAASGGDLAEIGRAFWRRVSDPALAPAERLFFEIYANALYGREWTASFRASVVSAWQQPLVDLLVDHGFPAEDAARRVRLGLAATRGLLLDLLITGDRDAVDAAYELLAPVFVAPPGTVSPTGGR